MILTTSPTLIRIRRSWQKHYSLETLKWFSEVKLAQTKLGFELLRNEINCIQECTLVNAL